MRYFHRHFTSGNANEVNIFPFQSMAVKMNIKLQIYITIKPYRCHINKQQMPKGKLSAYCILNLPYMLNSYHFTNKKFKIRVSYNFQ